MLGLNRAKRDNLGNPIVAVLLRHVPDNLASPTIVKVNVDIGQRDPVGVQEAFENEAVTQGVEFGNSHGVRGERTGGGSTPRPDANTLLAGPRDEVGHHQEVAGEAHVGDDVYLVGRLRTVLLADAVREPAR